MAKANVLVRRIRAYSRRIEEMLQTGTLTQRVAAQPETRRLFLMRQEASAEFEAFLASREKGPWAKFRTLTA